MCQTPMSTSTTTMCSSMDSSMPRGNPVGVLSLAIRLLAHERDLVEAGLADDTEQRHHLAIGDALVGTHVHDLVRIVLRHARELARQVAATHLVAADIVVAVGVDGHDQGLGRLAEV